jgi:hypothetical protein
VDPEEIQTSQEYVYGVPIPTLPKGVQPLEAVVLIKGIVLENGAPTITVTASDGMLPWDAVGLMEIESARLKLTYAMSATSAEDYEEEEE